MNERERPFKCKVKQHEVSGTVLLVNSTGIRDYHVVLNVDKAETYTFNMTMSGVGTDPLFKARGFTVGSPKTFIMLAYPVTAMKAADMFEFVINKIVEHHALEMQNDWR